MTPKSLLRHPRVTSGLEECAKGVFQPVLADVRQNAPAPDRVLLCSGKLYYELENYREENDRRDVAIVRLEELYPLPVETLDRTLNGYSAGIPVIWVQEEPENMGSCHYLRIRFGEKISGQHPFLAVARPASASPATGSANSHKQEQEQLIAAAFGEAIISRNGYEREHVNRIESPRSRGIHQRS